MDLLYNAIIVILYLCHVGATKVLNIAHRGSSGMLPEHTAEAYIRAIKEGADFIECDISITRDLKLVCRHESLLNYTTDVASREEFKDKINTYTIWGLQFTGWFTVDFTLNELKKLRAVQRYDFRDQSHNGLYEIATLDEYIAIAKEHGVGIYPEIKNAAWVNSIDLLPEGTRFEDIVVQSLQEHGFVNSSNNCLLQSFEEESLNHIKFELKSELPLVILFKTNKSEADLERYAQNGYRGVGCLKTLIIPCLDNTCHRLGKPTNLIQQCHDLGLKVHAFTFRNEDIFLAWDYQSDPHMEIREFTKLGIDGIFTDFPATLDLQAHISETRPSNLTNQADKNAVNMTNLSYLLTIFIIISGIVGL